MSCFTPAFTLRTHPLSPLGVFLKRKYKYWLGFCLHFQLLWEFDNFLGWNSRTTTGRQQTTNRHSIFFVIASPTTKFEYWPRHTRTNWTQAPWGLTQETLPRRVFTRSRTTQQSKNVVYTNSNNATNSRYLLLLSELI